MDRIKKFIKETSILDLIILIILYEGIIFASLITMINLLPTIKDNQFFLALFIIIFMISAAYSILKGCLMIDKIERR